MAVSKRLRYEILRRDNHACRYCGGKAPDVELTVDHVIPVSLGGTDDPDNLVAACDDCNSGKTSSSPDAPLVADVAQDALRWRKAIELASEMASRERDARDAFCEAFHESWTDWSYEFRGERICDPLPGNWEIKLGELMAAGLSVPDIADAVNATMGMRRVKDRFAYFLGVARNKIAQRQSVAQELLRRGVV